MQGHPDQFFGNKTYSQHGEDLLIANLFWLMRLDRPSWLDIGCHHPWNISNTALLYKRGGRGVNVDANPHVMQEFREQRPEDLNVNVGVALRPGTLPFYMIDQRSGRNTFDKATAELFVKENPKFQIREVIQVPVMTLNQLVDEHCPAGFPDLLSIDAEGLDTEILAAADFRQSKPKVICFELYRKPEVQHSLRKHLWGWGYVEVVRMGSNLIFIDKKYDHL